MVHEFVISSIEDRGYPPTIREIGEHMDIRSTNGVNDHLKALERKGYLVRDQSKSRALRPLYNGSGDEIPTRSSYSAVMEVPLVGRIAAGNPIEAIDHAEDIITLGEGLLGRTTDVFALTVSGESMIEDGILDGDIIFVNRQQDANNGAIVAVMLDGEATVKRIYREAGHVRLQPANSAMEPIIVSAGEFLDTQILGRVVGVFRQV
jgi:repressor LexA